MNITTENFTPGELRHAFLTGMITELYNLFAEMQVKRSALVGSGNGIRKNQALMQIAGEIFGMTMRIPAHVEEAAFGAALFAMAATGEFGKAEELKQACIHYIV